MLTVFRGKKKQTFYAIGILVILFIAQRKLYWPTLMSVPNLYSFDPILPPYSVLVRSLAKVKAEGGVFGVRFYPTSPSFWNGRLL